MDNNDYLKKVCLPLGITVIICIVAYFLYKFFFSTPSSEINQISITSKKLRNIDLQEIVNNIQQRTPCVDDKTARLLYLSFQLIFRDYGRWQNLVVLHPPTESGIKLEGKQVDSTGIFFDAFFTMPFVKINNECRYQIPDYDKFLVDENDAIICNIVTLSDINFDKELRNYLLEKSIKIDGCDIKMAPVEIMFAKYVKFFILNVI